MPDDHEGSPKRFIAADIEGVCISNPSHATRTFGEDSPFGYSNPEMIRFLKLPEITIDPDKRDKIFRRIMPIFRADMPVTFLLPQVQIHIADRRIKGLSNNLRPEPVWFLEHLWLEDE